MSYSSVSRLVVIYSSETVRDDVKSEVCSLGSGIKVKCYIASICIAG